MNEQSCENLVAHLIKEAKDGVQESRGFVTFGDDDYIIAIVRCCADAPPNSELLRRLVVCWNILREIPTDMLDGEVLVPGLAVRTIWMVRDFFRGGGEEALPAGTIVETTLTAKLGRVDWITASPGRQKT